MSTQGLDPSVMTRVYTCSLYSCDTTKVALCMCDNIDLIHLPALKVSRRKALMEALMPAYKSSSPVTFRKYSLSGETGMPKGTLNRASTMTLDSVESLNDVCEEMWGRCVGRRAEGGNRSGSFP